MVVRQLTYTSIRECSALRRGFDESQGSSGFGDRLPTAGVTLERRTRPDERFGASIWRHNSAGWRMHPWRREAETGAGRQKKETRVVTGTIPIRTPEGQAELDTRARRLSQRHRTMLFLVDGKRGAVEVRRLAAQAGVPEGCFDELTALGLIMLAEPTFSLLLDEPSAPPAALHIDLPLPGLDETTEDSVLLPASRTLQGDSSLLGELTPGDSWLPSQGREADTGFAEARLILVRAVRAAAPVTGSLTLLRLRRARTRADLVALLDEVEARIAKPHRSLAAAQMLRRVRHLLGSPTDSSLAPA